MDRTHERERERDDTDGLARKQVRQIIEAIGAVNNKIAATNGKLDTLINKADYLRERINDVSTDIAGLRQQVTELRAENVDIRNSIRLIVEKITSAVGTINRLTTENAALLAANADFAAGFATVSGDLTEALTEAQATDEEAEDASGENAPVEPPPA